MNNLTLRNAKIIFRNFAGKASKFQPEGRRTFSVIIEDDRLVHDLSADGWLLKPLKKRDEDEPQRYHLPVAVYFGNYPPQVVMVSGNQKTYLDESTIQTLDWADILNVDLTIRPREYKIAGRAGIKAYLKTMVVTIQEDELLAELNDSEPYSDEEDVPF